MNIFYLDKDYNLAAQYHCDKHVVKMILETAQLLSTAHRVLDGADLVLPDIRDTLYYKATHKNHPSAVWARESLDNYMWLAELGIALCSEYTARYHKTHKTAEMLHDLRDFAPDRIKEKLFTEPPQCMPDEYKIPGNAIEAYRNYYKYGKAEITQWNHSQKPYWI